MRHPSDITIQSIATRIAGENCAVVSRSATAAELSRECAEALAGGANFPTIWHDILKGSPLVVGVPIQAAPDRLEIPLIHHQRLLFDSANKSFALD